MLTFLGGYTLEYRGLVEVKVYFTSMALICIEKMTSSMSRRLHYPLHIECDDSTAFSFLY